MATSLPSVTIPFNTWVDIYAETGITVGAQLIIQNIGSSEAKLVESATEPTSEPATEPTAEPTTEPTVEPASEPATEPTPNPTEEAPTETTPEPAPATTANLLIDTVDWSFVFSQA